MFLLSIFATILSNKRVIMKSLVIVKNIVSASSFLKSSTLFHVCNDTYLIDGPSQELEYFFNSSHCIDYKDCLFPESDWVQDYCYLGDIHIFQNVKFDLRLNGDSFYEYQVISKLPKGLFFSNGLLFGASEEETEVIDIEVVAIRSKYKVRYRKFQIRFYKGINKAKSYTFEDYLSFGYGENLVDYDPTQVYYRIIKESVSKSKISPMKAAQDAAIKIHQEANGKKIELYVSGGVDSQCMAQSFINAKVPFQPVLMIDEGGSNEEDVHYCRKFFTKQSIELKEFTVSYKDYIQSYKYLNLAMKYRFNNPEYGLLLELMNNKDAFPVYAGRPISVSHGRDGRVGLGLAVDETLSRARFLERERRNGCPEFLIYTKELIESFLNDSYIKNFSEDKWLYKNKVEMLEAAGFDVSCAPSKKYTGFEKLGMQFSEDHFGHDLWLHHRGPLKYRFQNSSQRNVIPLNEKGIGDWKDVILKSYEDGFSYSYIQKNMIEDFH